MPAVRPVVCAPLDQVYIYGGVPFAVTLTAPSFPPKQLISVDEADTPISGGSLTVVEANAVHPLLSTTVTL